METQNQITTRLATAGQASAKAAAKAGTAARGAFLRMFENSLKASLPNVLEDAQRSAAAVIGRKDVPTEIEVDGVMVEVPADLRDTNSDYTDTDSGDLVSSTTPFHDFGLGSNTPGFGLSALLLTGFILVSSALVATLLSYSYSPLYVFLVTAAVQCALAYYVFNEEGWLAAKITLLTVPTCGLYLPFVFWRMDVPVGGTVMRTMSSPQKGDEQVPVHFKDEASLLHHQSTQDYAGSAFKSFRVRSKRLRTIQAKNAKKDKSLFIELGITTGILSAFGDRNAPDEGLIFGMTIDDLEQQLIVPGETGSGKTESVAFPLAARYCASGEGLAAFCGKNQLARELKAALPNFTLLSPYDTKINLFAGMNPLDVTTALAIPGDREDGDWYESAKNFFYQNAVLLYAVAQAKLSDDYKWTPACLRKLVGDNITQGISTDTPHGIYRTKALELAAGIKDDILLDIALDWMTGGNAKTEIRATAFNSTSQRMNNWLFPLFNHAAIAKWATTASDDGFDVTTALTGAQFGFDFGVDCAEDTTRILNNIVRQRIYVALRNRGKNWKKIPGQKHVMFMIDEAHTVLSKNDSTQVSMVRDSGGILVILTQSVSALHEKMGKETAVAMLANFVNAIAFKTNDEGITDEFMAIRAGTIMRNVSTIYREDAEVQGFNPHGAISRELRVPRDANGGVSSIHKRTLRQSLVNAVTDSGKEAATASAVPVFGNCALSTSPTITPAEIRFYLEEPYTALCVIKRGKIVRRDIVSFYKDPEEKLAA